MSRETLPPTSRRGSGPRLRGLGTNLALVLGSLALGLVLLEVGLRSVGPQLGDWYAVGPERLGFLRDHVRRNTQGFRDREFSREPPRESRRLLAVGDSFTFGDGIERVEDTWPRVLERVLSARAGPCEVYNLGIPGTNTAFQRRMLLDRDAYGYGAERIVLGFGLNDPEPPGANRTIIPRRLYRPLVPSVALDGWLTRRSFGYASMRRAHNVLLEWAGLNQSYADYVHSLYDPRSTEWSAFVAQARGLVADARQRGVGVTVAIFPMFHDLEHYPFVAEHRAARQVFLDAGADVLDLLDTFRGMDTASLRLAPADAHPNERAHRIAGEAIGRHLLPGLRSGAAPTGPGTQ
jgi:hypothetical protein